MSGYLLDEEGKLLVQMAREFAEKELKPRVADCDRNGEFPLDLYQRAAELGLSYLEIPEQYGGPEVNYVTVGAVYEEIGRIDAGFAISMAASSLGYKPILLGGSPEQNKLYADAIMAGKFVSFALTEPNAGSDNSAISTTAVRKGDEYILNGTKCFITNGGVADLCTVFATVDPSKGIRGLTCFIVEKGTPGFSSGKEENKMGIRLSNTTEVIFRDVRIPASNLVGREGGGFKLAMNTLDLARCAIGPFAVGIAQRALEESVTYAKNRVQFGKPISALQAIQFILADMAIRTETARQMAAHALTLAELGQPYGLEGAIAKCYSADIAVQNALDAIQIMGGYGYSRDFPVEKLLRDAKIFQIFEGTNQIQRAVIASHIMR
ncbi:MAG: acyl-CoA dehydrogenase family protein [Deltaproteobacteria bacterium]|jgi:butyryl-CoA dehydrogenase|nr:acyl-CoA dehydrogenase family protein [Deltaproteobacteria bacterium]